MAKLANPVIGVLIYPSFSLPIKPISAITESICNPISIFINRLIHLLYCLIRRSYFQLVNKYPDTIRANIHNPACLKYNPAMNNRITIVHTIPSYFISYLHIISNNYLASVSCLYSSLKSIL